MAALGSAGGAVVGAADALRAGLVERLGVGAVGLAALLVAGAAVGAVGGAPVGAALAGWRRTRSAPHLAVWAGAGAVAGTRFALGLEPGGDDPLAWLGAAALLTLALVGAAGVARWTWGPKASMVGLVAVGAAWAVVGRPAPVSPGPSTREQPNLLVVTVGGLRPDRLGSWPIDTAALDRVASEGVSFELAWAPSPDTRASARALWTARGPWDGGAATPDTLAARLREEGWATGAVVGTAELARDGILDLGFQVYDDEQGWAKGFSRALPGLVISTRRGARAERRADEVVDRALRWLGATSGRWLLWVHLHDPAAPFEPPPPWDERYYAGSDPRASGRPPLAEVGRVHPVQGDRLAGVTDPAWVEARYDGEVAFADAQITRLMEAVELRGLAPTTLVVVAGLHGEVLRDGATWYGRDGELIEAALRVPVAIRLPARLPAGDRVAAPVELGDLAPTLLELLGEERPIQGATGISLRPAMDGTGRPRGWSRASGPGSSREVALRAPGLLYRRHPVDGDVAIPVYDAGALPWTADRLAGVAAAAAALDGTGRPPPDAALMQELADGMLPVLPDPPR